jgi:glycosyltransferase involved in cell wall biosynthesis
MPGSAPLLTIGIPTYNRARCLERLLAILGKELEGETRVELLVSDNASTDGTSSIVDAYRAGGKALRYIRNAENLGADRNILQVFNLALGKYVWIFSDDDLMAPGTVRRVLEAVSAKTYELICVTAYFSKSENIQLRKFTPARDLEFANANDLARRVHVLFTFISGVIINKERVSETAHPPFESLFDTSLGQLGPFFTALNCHRRSLLIRDPLVTATANRSVGYGLYRVFGTNLAKITNEWIEDESVRRSIINGTIQKFLPVWVLLSRKSLASSITEDPHQILRICFGKYSRYWIFIYPMYALPLPLASAWLMLVRVINKFQALVSAI